MPPSNKHIKYFAYGSNLDPNWLKTRCPSAVVVGPALLRDYELKYLYASTSYPGGGAADIVFQRGSETWGVVYSISPKDMLELDKYEDVAERGYRRIDVLIEFDEGPEKAVAYEVVSKLPKEFAPLAGYGRLLVNGARIHGLPQHYQLLLADKIKSLQEAHLVTSDII